MRADFKRKEPRVTAKQCVIEKTIILPEEKYDYFTQHLLQDYDFIDQNRALMGEWDGAWHCLLVTGESMGEGILIQSEGAAYARYSSVVPSVSALIVQKNCEIYGQAEEDQTESHGQQMT